MIFTTLSFDGSHVIERCAECGAQVSIDSLSGRGIQLLKHDAFVAAHERCGERTARLSPADRAVADEDSVRA